MSKSSQIRIPSKDDLARLEFFSSLLHLFHHRNHNQHRRSSWYRHFSLFRRHLAALLADYTTLSASLTTNVERTRLKALTSGLQTRISQRLAFWQDVLVARWMRAFSQVVADGRFSVLGLVMLGVLGGVCKVVGIVDGLEAEGQAEIERVLEEFGREAWGDESTFGQAVARDEDDGGEAIARVEGEPVVRAEEGEVVAREVTNVDQAFENDEDGLARDAPMGQSDDKPTTAVAVSTITPSPPKASKTKTTSTKKRSAETKPKAAKKKCKKGGDAIDDLFSGW